MFSQHPPAPFRINIHNRRKTGKNAVLKQKDKIRKSGRALSGRKPSASKFVSSGSAGDNTAFNLPRLTTSPAIYFANSHFSFIFAIVNKLT